MDLHGQIMSLPDAGGLSEIGTTQGEQLAFKRGHKQARHAAAELALGVEAQIAAAVAAERERWARRADEYATWGGSNFAEWFGKLAAEIRTA